MLWETGIVQRFQDDFSCTFETGRKKNRHLISVDHTSTISKKRKFSDKNICTLDYVHDLTFV
jgi:hypothetical protein